MELKKRYNILQATLQEVRKEATGKVGLLREIPLLLTDGTEFSSCAVAVLKGSMFSVISGSYSKKTQLFIEELSIHDEVLFDSLTSSGYYYRHGLILFPIYKGQSLKGILVLKSKKLPSKDTREFLFHISSAMANSLSKESAKPTQKKDSSYMNNLRAIVQSFTEPVYYKDAHNRYLGCNRAFEEFSGLSSEDIYGRTVFELEDDATAQRHNNVDTEMLKNGISKVYESDFHTKDGSLRQISISKSVFKDGTGEIAGTISVIKDMTALKAARQQYEAKNNELMKINAILLNSQKEIIDFNKRLTESEEKYRLLIENQQEFVVKLDVTGTFIFASHSFCSFIQLGSEEIDTMQLQDLLIGTDKIKLDDVLRNLALQEDESYSEFRIRAGNSFYWIAWSFKSVFHGRELESIIGVGRDVTEQKRAEAELQNYRSVLEAAFTQNPNPLILIKYPEKSITMINEAAQRFFKLSRESYVDTPVEELKSLKNATFDEKNINLYDLLISEKLYYEAYSNTEIKFEYKDGTLHYGLLYSTPIYNTIGELNSYLLIFPDITDIKMAEQRIDEQNKEMQKIQKLESIGVLAGGIAHDFNNILSAILGNLSLIRFYEPHEKTISFIDKAETAIGRAKELTNQLLTFSKGGAPIKKTTSLNDIVHDSAIFSLHGASTDVHFNLAENLLPGLVDTGQISQVIQNLVINAAQAMPDGGTIEIKTENYNHTDKSMPLEEGAHILITVADTGPGIPPEIADKIFDPFFTTKQNGNGLGLATSYTIVMKHNGYISFESSPKGTKFFVYLQASKNLLEENCEHICIDEEYEGRLLIMDDDEDIRQTAAQLFNMIGFDAQIVPDGTEAVQQAKHEFENSSPFDLYVMDLTVPGGMGGKEATEKIRSFDTEAKIIVSSGYSNNEVLSQYKSHGFCGVLEKPYTADNIKKVLKEISYEPRTNKDA